MMKKHILHIAIQIILFVVIFTANFYLEKLDTINDKYSESNVFYIAYSIDHYCLWLGWFLCSSSIFFIPIMYTKLGCDFEKNVVIYISLICVVLI